MPHVCHPLGVCFPPVCRCLNEWLSTPGPGVRLLKPMQPVSLSLAYHPQTLCLVWLRCLNFFVWLGFTPYNTCIHTLSTQALLTLLILLISHTSYDLIIEFGFKSLLFGFIWFSKAFIQTVTLYCLPFCCDTESPFEYFSIHPLPVFGFIRAQWLHFFNLSFNQ